MKSLILILGFILPSILISYMLTNTYTLDIKTLFGISLFILELYFSELIIRKKDKSNFAIKLEVLNAEIQESELNVKGLKYDFPNFSADTKK